MEIAGKTVYFGACGVCGLACLTLIPDKIPVCGSHDPLVKLVYEAEQYEAEQSLDS